MNASPLLFTLLIFTAPPLLAETTPVEVAQLRYEQRAKEVRSSGRVAPVAEQILSFKVAGVVQQINVESGQTVRKGELIASLDLEEINAKLERARALVADAGRQVERLRQLRERQLASDEQLRLAETALQVAQADLRVASFNRQHAEIRAPQDGRILERLLEDNQFAQPGDPIVLFADTTQGWVVTLQVADVDVVRLNHGDPALIRMDAYPGQSFNGRVRTIAGKADPRSLTFAVEIELAEPPRLYAGLIAHTTVLPQQTTALAQLPLTALVRANGHNAELFVLDDQDKAHKTPVQIAWIAGNDVLIHPGPAANSRVVTRGGSLLYSGASVRTLP